MTRGRWALAAAGVAVVGVAIWLYVDRGFWPRGEALHVALTTMRMQGTPDQKLVANAVWDSYLEARTNATWWSAAYFGATFAAAVASALAGLILKLESLISREALKKDLAALLSVSAAVLVTISTSGDFQRKWQANRTAAAELENIGYELLETSGREPLLLLPKLRKALYDRHTSIVGTPSASPAPK